MGFVVGFLGGGGGGVGGGGGGFVGGYGGGGVGGGGGGNRCDPRRDARVGRAVEWGRGAGFEIFDRFCENSLFLLQFATAHAIKSCFNQRIC